MKNNCLPTYLEIILILFFKSPNKLSIGSWLAVQKNSISSFLWTSVFCQCLSWLKWTTFLFSTSQAYGPFFFHLNNKISLMKKSIVDSTETWDEQSRFYFWSYSAMACHKLSHFNSGVFILGFTWNCCRLQETKKFSRSPGQSKCDTR